MYIPRPANDEVGGDFSTRALDWKSLRPNGFDGRIDLILKPQKEGDLETGDVDSSTVFGGASANLGEFLEMFMLRVRKAGRWM